MSVERTCDGKCCAVFALFDGIENRQATEERDFIMDMVIPLSYDEALARAAKFGVPVESIPKPRSGWSPYTCRHWDEETRLCTVYEQRPRMCRDFPYDGPCRMGCDYCAPPEVQEEYRVMREKQKAKAEA